MVPVRQLDWRAGRLRAGLLQSRGEIGALDLAVRDKDLGAAGETLDKLIKISAGAVESKRSIERAGKRTLAPSQHRGDVNVLAAASHVKFKNPVFRRERDAALERALVGVGFRERPDR